MKKFLSFLFVLLAFGGAIKAQTNVQGVLYINPVTIEQGSQGVIRVYIDTQNTSFRDFEFSIILPEGVSPVYQTSNGLIRAVVSNDQPKSEDGDKLYNVSSNIPNTNNPNKIRFVFFNPSGIPANSGELMLLYVTIDEDKAIGSELSGSMTDIIISGNIGDKGYRQDDFDFTVKVGGTITYSDTKSYDDFEPASNVNVKVSRAVKANTWNTICLPFAMSAEQIHNVFGPNAKVADFTGCETKWTATEDRVSGIQASFTLVDNMEAHHPYLLKVVDDGYGKTATEGFTVEGVNVVGIPGGEARVDVTEPDGWEDSFIGTYQPISLGDEKPVVFLSDNQFWYATPQGPASLKGFRGYLSFDALDLYLETNELWGSSNLSFFVDGEEVTAIEGVTTNNLPMEGVFDLQGRKVEVGENGVNGLQKGVYIVNGKKVTVK